MASSNKTQHYDLSQFVPLDKPAWLGDYNSDMQKIDAGIYAAQSKADSLETEVKTASAAATAAQQAAQTANEAAQQASDKAQDAQNTANGVSATASQALTTAQQAQTTASDALSKAETAVESNYKQWFLGGNHGFVLYNKKYIFISTQIITNKIYNDNDNIITLVLSLEDGTYCQAAPAIYTATVYGRDSQSGSNIVPYQVKIRYDRVSGTLKIDAVGTIPANIFTTAFSYGMA